MVFAGNIMRFFFIYYYEHQINLQEIKFTKVMDPSYGWALLEIWKLLFFHTELPVFAAFSWGSSNSYWLQWGFVNMTFCRKFELCISCLFCPHLVIVVSPFFFMWTLCSWWLYGPAVDVWSLQHEEIVVIQASGHW